MKSVTFYYSSANYNEGKSVARALPCFIKDTLKVKPEFYCSSQLIAEGINGFWDNEKRSFLTEGEKAEKNKLGDLENAMLATNEHFISLDHQRAMATENDSVSLESRLTKKDASPKATTNSDDISDITGSANSKSTTESKAKRYATMEVKKVAQQYSSTISGLNSELDDKDEELALLKSQLARLQATRTKSNKSLFSDEESSNPSKEESEKDDKIDSDLSLEKEEGRDSDKTQTNGKTTTSDTDCDKQTLSNQQDCHSKSDDKYEALLSKRNLVQYYDTEDDSDDIDMVSPPRVHKNKGIDFNAPYRSPFRKGKDSKDDYSVQTDKNDLLAKRNKSGQLISPNANMTNRQSSSRLRKETTASSGNGSGPAL